MILETQLSGLLATLAIFSPIAHARPFFNATTHIIHGNLSVANDGPDGYGPVDEGKVRCLSAAGLKYHPHHMCKEDWDDSWSGGKYFMYDLEFQRLMSTPKWRGMGGTKVSEAACESYKKSWRASDCKKGRDEKHAFCCRVFRVQDPIKEPSVRFVNGSEVHVWDGKMVPAEELFGKLLESGMRYLDSPEEMEERLKEEKAEWEREQEVEMRATGERKIENRIDTVMALRAKASSV